MLPFVAGLGCNPGLAGGLAGSEKVLGAEKSFGNGRDGRGKVLMGAVSIRQIVSLQPLILP